MITVNKKAYQIVISIYTSKAGKQMFDHVNICGQCIKVSIYPYENSAGFLSSNMAGLNNIDDISENIVRT